MTQSLTNIDAALKDVYGPGLRNSINNKNVVFSQVAKNETDIVGRRAVWAVHTRRSPSTASLGELETLPTPGYQGFTQATDNLAATYHTIKVSGPAKHLTRNDTGSFVRALEVELKGAERDLRNDMSRQVFNQLVTLGSTSALGSLGGASTAYSSSVYTFGNATDGEMRTLFIGMRVNVRGSTGSDKGNFTITAVDVAARTVTLSAAPTGAAAGDHLFREGSFAAAATWGHEINGLRHLVSDSTVYAGIDPATEPQWRAVTHGSTSTAISELVLVSASEKVETDGVGDAPNLWITSHAQRRSLANTLQAQKRFDGKQVTLKAGWIGLETTVGPLVVDRYAPDNRLFGINTSEIQRFVGLDFTWDDDDGRVLLRTATQDAVEARMKCYHNLEATNRNSHIVVTLQVPA